MSSTVSATASASAQQRPPTEKKIAKKKISEKKKNEKKITKSLLINSQEIKIKRNLIQQSETQKSSEITTEKKKAEKKMNASPTEKKMTSVEIVEQTPTEKKKTEKKKTEKKKTEKVNKKIVVANADCFINPTADDVCYNASENQHLLVKGLKIRYRYFQQSYKKKENDFSVGEIDRIRDAKSPQEKKRGDVVVCVYDEINNKNEKLYFDDSLIWGLKSAEPLHKILDGQLIWGGLKYKKQVWRWVKDYDTNYVVNVKEKKKGGGRKTHAQYKDEYMKGLIEMSKNKDNLNEALKTDGLFLELVKNITSTIKVNKSSLKIIGLNKL